MFHIALSSSLLIMTGVQRHTSTEHSSNHLHSGYPTRIIKAHIDIDHCCNQRHSRYPSSIIELSCNATTVLSAIAHQQRSAAAHIPPHVCPTSCNPRGRPTVPRFHYDVSQEGAVREIG
ncbi:uncharacterized protein LOC135486731 [Lineus longissimus]|uniref:uncharacterized protein LOC135486731 n=1 Tax=Lineus longissimus TaxID=88925 RepID=UPI00315CED73